MALPPSRLLLSLDLESNEGGVLFLALGILLGVFSSEFIFSYKGISFASC
jgi:hypothetical protein